MTATEYFNNHTLNETFLKDTFAVSSNDKAITIPIYDIDGKLLYCRYRHLEGTAKFTSDKGSHPALFAIHKVKKHNEIVMCEGEPDAMRLWQEGIPAITSTSGVKTFSTKLAAPLKGKIVTIILDNDEAGSSAVEKYYKTLEEVGAKPLIVTLPKEQKDICDYFTAGFTKTDFDNLPTQTLDGWLDQNEPKEYALESFEELSKEKIPAEEWLVNRILPAEGFCFWVGAESTAKSFVLISLAHAVASGKPWLDAKDEHGNYLFGVPKPQNVLIIDKENTRRRTQARINWMNIAHPNIFRVRYPHYFELADPNEEDGFSKIGKSIARKVKKNNIKLLMIDSFTDVMVGNENAAGDVQGFFDAMRRLFPGISCQTLHHASKPAAGVVRTSSQRTRGSTNIMAQVYSAFYVENMPKSKREFIVEQTKSGDAEKLSRFIIELDVQPTGNGDNTKVVGILYKGIMPDEEMKMKNAINEIADVLSKSSQMLLKELVDFLQTKGISAATSRRAIKELTSDGVIEKQIDPDNKARKIIVWVGSNKNTAHEDQYAEQADLLG